MKARSKTRLWLAALVLVIATLFGLRPTPVHDAPAPAPHAQAAIAQVAVTQRAELPPIAAGTLRLEGQVVDLQDQPIGGAQVTLGGQRVATSEADGSFVFDGLAPETYVITAELGELYGEDSAATLTESSDPVTIHVRRGPALRVRVIAAESGTPIAGAIVHATDRDARTDASGLAVLRAMDAGYEHVRITADGRASQKLSLTCDDPLATIERTVELAVGADVGGVVLDQAGNPVADASVRVSAAGDTWSDGASTDDAGRWSMPAFGPGKHGVHASSSRHLAQPDLVFEHDGATARTDLVVRVALGGEIAGVVVDEAGRPVAGARVHTGNGAEDSDASGRFVVPGAETGVHEVYAASQHGISQTTKIEVAGSSRVELKLVLIRSSLAGVVVDSRGQPIDNAIVAAKLDGRTTYTRSDELGRFDFGGVLPGDYEVSAQRDAEISRDLPPGFTVKSGNRRVRIALPDLASVSGRVLLDGRPVAFYGFVVTSTPEILIGRPTTVREAHGRFAEDHLAPGTWHVVLVGPGFTRHVVENVRLAAGQHRDLGDIAVSAGRTLAGRVVDERGAPIAGATVGVFERRFEPEAGVLRHGMESTATAQTDAAGRFRVTGISATATLAQATHPARGMTEHRAIAAYETSVELVIAGAGGIDGTVVNGRRYSNVIATLTTNDDLDFRTSVDSTGSFRFDRLPVGTYHVQLLGGAKIARQLIDVRAGQRTPMQIALPVQLITLAVHAPSCQVITLRAAATSEALDLESCAHGVATFARLVPGHHEVCIDDGACHPIEIHAAPVLQTVELQP